jgi:hypothetical protein
MATETLSGARSPIERRWLRYSTVGLAAAAVFALLVWPPDRSPRPDLREPTLTTTVAPEPIAPRAAVARVREFVWVSVPRAQRYRVRLYDSEGVVVWRVETTDTSVVMPDSVILSQRDSYFWKVEAQTDWQRWAASDLVEFRLTGAPR